MFTGIVRGIGKIASIQSLPGLTQFSISIDPDLLKDLEVGASIAIDGTCLTVVSFTSDKVVFDAIQETLDKTNMKFLKVGDLVNVERAARFGDEIGGHVLSGHIYGTAMIQSIKRTDNNCAVSLKCPVEWTNYLFPKGYIALNGASLTLVDVDKENGSFSVHLIPETLKKTTFGTKKEQDFVNVELESQTQIIVDTIERIHACRFGVR
jgi:riboflavin synthase